MDYINTNTYSGQAEVMHNYPKSLFKRYSYEVKNQLWKNKTNRMMNMLRSHVGTYFKFAYYHLEGCYLEHLWTPSSTPTWKIFSNKLTHWLRLEMLEPNS